MERIAENLKLCDSDYHFMLIVWENAPVKSGELVGLCKEKLGWKKSTTYTVLKRLCDKGLFRNEGGMVSSRMTKEEYASAQSEKFVEETFQGSLPAFLAAFTNGKKLSQKEIAEIQQIIEKMGEE